MNIKSIVNRIFFVVLALLLTIFGIVRSTLYIGAKADDTAVTAFDKRSVLDDLENSLINGEEFSLKKYSFDITKNTQVISFLEYSYSFYDSLQGDFGFYVYVYNPQGLHFVVNSPLHSISFKVGENKSDSYSKYPLSVVSISQGDYYGLFYKLKVNLTDEEKQNVLSKVNSTERVYSVSEIELMEEGKTNATVIPMQGIYKFSGYMSGYGSNSLAENSLKCINEQLETLSLKPHTTTYRPEGTNGKNDYTQDSLHSVYFAVPNSFIETYGEMTAVHATWLNAVLKPALVTGNQEAYTAINEYLGKNLTTINNDGSWSNTKDLGYLYAHIMERLSSSNGVSYMCGYTYNSASNDEFYGDIFNNVDPLYILFNAGSGEDSADNYTVRSEDIHTTLEKNSTHYDGDLVNGKYAACMFDSVDSKFTEVNICRDDEYDLTSEVLGTSWWDRLWGNTYVSTFDGIKAIYSVSDSDFTGNIERDCSLLYIGSQDYLDFKQYYENSKTDSTVYLFRYQVSDYIAQEATLFEYDDSWFLGGWKEKDTNAYFFQETVNLDFDIIDVTFSTGEVETIIPAVMSPIDVIPDATPPVYTESDSDWLVEVLTWIIGLLLLGLLGFILFIFSFTIKLIWSGIKIAFKYALKGIKFVICLPFKLIGKLFKRKKIKKTSKNRNKAYPEYK